MASSSERVPLLSRRSQARRHFFEELLGWHVLYDLDRDVVILMKIKALRMFSFGFLAVILVLYLSDIGLTEVRFACYHSCDFFH